MGQGEGVEWVEWATVGPEWRRKSGIKGEEEVGEVRGGDGDGGEMGRSEDEVGRIFEGTRQA